MRPMRIFFPCLLLLLLAGCGQTGDLYLPSKTPPASQQPLEQKDKKPQQTPAPVSQPN